MLFCYIPQTPHLLQQQRQGAPPHAAPPGGLPGASAACAVPRNPGPPLTALSLFPPPQDQNNPFSESYQHRENFEKYQQQEQQRIQMEQHIALAKMELEGDLAAKGGVEGNMDPLQMFLHNQQNQKAQSGLGLSGQPHTSPHNQRPFTRFPHEGAVHGQHFPPGFSPNQQRFQGNQILFQLSLAMQL